MYEVAERGLRRHGIELSDVLEEEVDPGLGTEASAARGLLPRLDATLASRDGYGIRYEFGIFEQRIRDGFQVEVPDAWSATGTHGRSRATSTP